MSVSLRLLVSENHQLQAQTEFEGPLELGRQKQGDEGLYGRTPTRFVVARLDENSVSREHLRCEPMPGGKVRLINRSATQTVLFDGHPRLPPGATCDVPLPAVFRVGPKTIRIEKVSDDGNLHSLAQATIPPSLFASSRNLPLQSLISNNVRGEELIDWLSSILNVLQAAADSPDFFKRAAQAVLDMLDFDSGQVLLLAGDRWTCSAQQHSSRVLESESFVPSQRILRRLRAEKRTFWEHLDLVAQDAPSLVGVTAVVASPVLDRLGAVIGAVYGERRKGPASLKPITKVEAMLVELLARSVAAGLARLEQERAALESRVRFEQFFTRSLAEQLAREPDLLRGREADVSVLFCDIRAFSRLSERLGPAVTVEWVRDVMTAFSECVLDQEGVLASYIGDELMAFWGAPGKQPDHADRACRAALAMAERLPALNQTWEARLGEPLHVGVGVNSGPALVGNNGTPYKFTYGATGNTVNLASRVQGMTKQLKCRILITDETRKRFVTPFLTRKLCRAKVINIAAAVEVHELVEADRPDWGQAKEVYEEALGLFDRRDFSPAARLLGAWRMDHSDDAPALVLLYRVIRCMVEAPAAEHPVWVFSEK